MRSILFVVEIIRIFNDGFFILFCFSSSVGSHYLTVECLKSAFVTTPEANIYKLVPVAQRADIIAASELGNHLKLELIKI